MDRLLKNGLDFLFRRQSSILSAAVIIMVTYGFSFLLGLLKTWLLVRYFFHQPQILDVYYAASIIPDAVFQLIVTGSLSAAFIPVFSKILTHDEKKAWNIASIVLNIILTFLVGISILVFVFSQPLSRLISPGFSLDQILLQSQLLRIMLFSQLFFTVSGFLTAALQTHRHFLIPAIAPLIYNLSIILGIIILGKSLGIFGPVFGMVFGSFLHMAVQYPLARKLGFSFSLNWNLQVPEVKDIIRLLPPRILTIAVDQVEQFSVTVIGSFLVSGSLTLFNLAKTLSFLPVTLFGVSLGQASLPVLSGYSNSNRLVRFQKSLIDSLLQVAFLVVPISVLFIILRVQLVRLAFGAPSLPWKATIVTGQTLAVLAVSAVFSAAIQLLIRGFYALHDTHTPLYIGIISAILNILLSLLLGLYFHQGIVGIAVGWSVVAALECLLLCLTLFIKLKISINTLFPPLIKILISGLSTSLAFWLPMRFLDQFVFDTTRTFPLLVLTSISGVIGFVVYLAMSYLFHVDELYSFLNLFRRLRPRL